MPPRSALTTLARFESLASTARADHDRVLAAKRALGLLASAAAVAEAGGQEQGGDDEALDPLKCVLLLVGLWGVGRLGIRMHQLT